MLLAKSDNRLGLFAGLWDEDVSLAFELPVPAAETSWDKLTAMFLRSFSSACWSQRINFC